MVVNDLMEQHYFQPSFYRFDEDSIYLAKYISKHLNVSTNRILEVGAGCGVISLELSKFISPRSIQSDLIEKQKDFEESLKKNIKTFGQENSTYSVFWEDFLEREFLTSYPCIFSNPPFFYSGSSRPSEDSRRDQCRQISNLDFKNWIFKMVELLEPGGDLFFCHRDSKLAANDFQAKEVERVTFNKSVFFWWRKPI